VGGWFIWKLIYYGNLLPNPLYARPLGEAWLRGIYYIWTFLWTYGLIILLPVFAFAFITCFRRGSWQIELKLVPIALFVILWSAYLVYVGGDWMAFRMLVPIMPFVYILAFWLIWRYINRVALQAILMLTLFATALFPLPFNPAADVYETESDLDEHFAGLRMDEIGIRMGEMLGQDETVTIAVTDAGTIPYYSRLRTVDMLGISDPWVLHNGILLVPNETFGSLPGHMRIAPVEYLWEKKVNIVISHPWLLSAPDDGYRRYSWNQLPFEWPGFPLMFAGEVDAQPADAMLVIPIAEDLYLRAIYLTPHPVVDAAIVEFDWQVFPLK
jgi:hypothetical protein